MSVEPASHDRAALDLIVRRLEAAWNTGDGEAFASPFAEDADFVTIRGEHFSGRAAIGAGHAAIFRTIYAGSTNHMTVEAAPWSGSTPVSRCLRGRWPERTGHGLPCY